MQRFLVLMIRRPAFDPAVVPSHHAYLEHLRAQGHNEMSGGFGDKSGGAYLLRAESLAQAQTLVQQDPAFSSGGWDVTVREWLAK